MPRLQFGAGSGAGHEALEFVEPLLMYVAGAVVLGVVNASAQGLSIGYPAWSNSERQSADRLHRALIANVMR